jgi:type II secretory ATPase GspE/PulE/Tfp pilus assembly ATPase PilB-like protein
MQTQIEHERELLEKFAQASNHKIVDSQADLDPKDRAMPEMLTWCRRQGDIVVLKSGAILTSNPSSRAIQNCKIVMVNHGLHPGRVMAATRELVQILLANAELQEQKTQELDIHTVSTQQQRLRMLVKEAVLEGASDIHIEVRPDVAKIRFRIHGELYLHAEWIPKLGREIASVAFNKETDHAITHFNPMVPQNASMPLEIDGENVRLRLASMPAHGGFDVVMRILTAGDEKIQSLEELGYPPEQIALIKKASSLPHGAVIMSGPTGSGKTTTLASALSIVNNDRKIYTIEDPVEKVVKTATQVPVNVEHDDRGFANMGRSTLRMDPDVIVLGEMRDEDTAKVMVRASITGHLVFSTLHTNTAPAIITRLVDMGISPALLSDPNLLACLICQRLLPKLCSDCAIPLAESAKHKPHLARWKKAFTPAELKKIRARGEHCEKCHGLGISGRTVVAEIVWVDEPGRHFIQKCDILGWEKHLKDNGWSTYRDQAIKLVKSGIVDPLDAEKMIGEIVPATETGSFDYKSVQ